MNFKGTKGEWRIEHGYSGNGGGVFSITTDENNIATIWDAAHEEETAMNAQLIVTAPKLLKALMILNGDIEKAPVRFTKEEKKRIMQDAINEALK